MNNRKIVKIIALILALVFLVAIILVIMRQVDNHFNRDKKMVSMTAMQEKGKHSVEMMKEGYMKMLTGEIIEIDNKAKSFVMDTDPLGNHEKYIIYTDEKTKFSILTYDYKANTEEELAELENEIEISMEYSPADFNAITPSSQAEVYLNNWIDDSKKGQQLIAERVNIVTE